MASEHGCCNALDVLTLADIADLVFRAQLLGKRAQPILSSRQQNDLRIACRECTCDRLADPARSTGDDGYLQTRTCRVAARVCPPASKATARSACFPVRAEPRFHEPE
jgi:hypothetical protein